MYSRYLSDPGLTNGWELGRPICTKDNVQFFTDIGIVLTEDHVSPPWVYLLTVLLACLYYDWTEGRSLDIVYEEPREALVACLQHTQTKPWLYEVIASAYRLGGIDAVYNVVNDHF